jgi:hypothetical protein
MSATEMLSLTNKREKPSAATNNRWFLKITTTNMRKKTLPCEDRMAILLYINVIRR